MGYLGIGDRFGRKIKHSVLDMEHQSRDAPQAGGRLGSEIKREIRIEAIN